MESELTFKKKENLFPRDRQNNQKVVLFNEEAESKNAKTENTSQLNNVLPLLFSSQHVKDSIIKEKNDQTTENQQIKLSNSVTTEHKKKYSCDQCTKRFKFPSELKLHKTATHSAQKPFECDICSKRFRYAGNLKIHKLVHENKSYICSVETCKKSFNSPDKLRNHEKVHNDARGHVCNICELKFKRNADLVRHKKCKHENDRPYTCKECSKTFKISANLRKHERIHIGVKNYKCNTCEKSFFQSSALITHKKTHLEKTFVCEKCLAEFWTKTTLTTHTKSLHTEEGRKRKKTEQNRLRTVLETKFTVDEEVTIKFGPTCVDKSDNYRARLDFHPIEITTVFLDVECDEISHSGYPIPCELARMEKIHESILRQGIVTPVVFIRYNPNGKVSYDGITKIILRCEREKILMNLLEDIQKEQITFTNSLNIIYLFYSMRNGVPKVCSKPEYDKQMYNCVDFKNCK